MTNEELLEYTKNRLAKEAPDKLWAWENLLFLCVSGSRLYGLNNKDSDWDIRGVTVAPIDCWIGAESFNGPLELKEHNDEKIGITIYDFRKFVHLVGQCSPNIVEFLFVPNPLFRSDVWTEAVPNLKKLISLQSYKTYHAYGFSQINKLMGKAKESRADLVEKYGYDTKFAMHAFRLLFQGHELVTKGSITFPSPYAEFLIKIRNGMFKTKENVKAVWENYAKGFDESVNRSNLPTNIDLELKNAIVRRVFWQVVSGEH